jgi:KaiC/GvpD/RAD55 family RecA-like ATPase
MTRAKTGISGLDELIGGGLVAGSAILVSGGTGSGKTIFGLQFLYNGAFKYNEPGVYVTLETRPSDLKTEAKQFGWDLEELEEKNAIIIVDAASSKARLPTYGKYALPRGFDISTLAQEIYRAVEDAGAKRLVIDCVSALGMNIDDPTEVRSEIYQISALLRELKVTSLLLSETLDSDAKSRAGVEQFVTQGLISLNLFEDRGTLKRDMLIWKMRQTSHSLKKHVFTIGNKGIEIKSKKSSTSKSR